MRRDDLDPLFGIGGGSGDIEGAGLAAHGGGSAGIPRDVSPISLIANGGGSGC